MSSVQLLDKTRKIGKLLHNNNSRPEETIKYLQYQFCVLFVL